MTGELQLMVAVPADDWALVNRRVAYLEALLLRVVREESAFREWYEAAELEALRLPGLPPTRQAIARKASAEGWPRVRRGGRFYYHAIGLPGRAFDALISRIIGLPPLETATEGLFDLPYPAAREPLPQNAAPPWVLPLLRLLKGSAGGDLGKAWQALPDHLPEGTLLPDVQDAAEILVRFGLA